MQKILLSLFFIASLSFAEAQTNGFMLQASLGLVGDHNNQQATYSSFKTTHSFQSTISWAGGLAYQRFFSKRLGVKTGLLYEYAPVSRLEIYEYLRFRGVLRRGEINRRFINQSLLLPLQLRWQGKGIGFSAGLISNLHLSTKLEQNLIFFDDGVEINRGENSFQSGDFTVTGLGDTEKIYLEKKINFQLVFGVSISLNPRLALDLEYKDFLGQNLLVQEVTNYDVSGTFVHTFAPFARSFSLGISWIIL